VVQNQGQTAQEIGNVFLMNLPRLPLCGKYHCWPKVWLCDSNNACTVRLVQKYQFHFQYLANFAAEHAPKQELLSSFLQKYARSFSKIRFQFCKNFATLEYHGFTKKTKITSELVHKTKPGLNMSVVQKLPTHALEGTALSK